jgi:molybdenum cofactor cytidylyltransferase
MSSAIVPAAGAATRFGGDKLIADVGGRRLLDRTIQSLLDAGAEQVVVVVPPNAAWTAMIEGLNDPRVRTAVNPDPSRGMFSSIQLGANAVDESPTAVLPGDMPFVRADTIEKLLTAGRRTRGIVAPRFSGRRGHPVVIPGDVRAALISSEATTRLDEFLAAQPCWRVDIDLDDAGVLRDVDRKEDLSS